MAALGRGHRRARAKDVRRDSSLTTAHGMTRASAPAPSTADEITTAPLVMVVFTMTCDLAQAAVSAAMSSGVGASSVRRCELAPVGLFGCDGGCEDMHIECVERVRCARCIESVALQKYFFNFSFTAFVYK